MALVRLWCWFWFSEWVDGVKGIQDFSLLKDAGCKRRIFERKADTIYFPMWWCNSVMRFGLLTPGVNRHA